MSVAELGRRERKKEQTRHEILGAAWMLFEKNGVAATSVRDIAELADVSDATVYNYFPAKDDLVAAGVDANAAMREVVDAVTRRPASESAVDVLVNTYREFDTLVDDASLRAARRYWRIVRADDALRGASLRQQAVLARRLADALAPRRRPRGMSDLDLFVLCRAVVAAVDAVAEAEPARATAKTWMADVDRAVGRVAAGWRT